MRTLNEYFLTADISNVSNADQVYVAVPDGGKVIKAYSVLHGAISTSDATLTLKVNGTAMTNGTITITQSGSAAGDVDSCVPSANNEVIEGEAVEVETDGASVGASRVTIVLVIRR